MVNMVVISLGVAVAAFGEAKSNTFGVILQLGGVAVEATRTSALTMNVAGVVKDWLLIAFSWSVIMDTVTPINLVGYGLAFLGVAYYNHSKYKALRENEEQRRRGQEVADDDETGRFLKTTKRKDTAM
ncbi:conserved hypothetical protein [Ricinus communis]|uniref:Sugar phosphate transporter domain-containing protein n=1 Tax=Ricinus communis TaxID=3988 RepID=B9SER2_RICCO|nr:conserved hypothetical protein [Ricinus communis]